MTSAPELTDAPARGSFRLLESFTDAASAVIANGVRYRLGKALVDFPELCAQTVTVARRQEWDDRLGRADMLNRIIYLPVDRRTTWMTMYHELGHLAVQVRDERGKDVPTTSEEYCSLLAVSRMPIVRLDEDRIPYLGEPGIDRREWPRVCERALEYRKRKRNYVQKAKEWLDV